MNELNKKKEGIKDEDNSPIYPQDFNFPTYGSGNQTYQEGYYHGYRNAMKIVYCYLDEAMDDNTQQEQGANKENFKKWLEHEGDYIVKDTEEQIPPTNKYEFTKNTQRKTPANINRQFKKSNLR